MSTIAEQQLDLLNEKLVDDSIKIHRWNFFANKKQIKEFLLEDKYKHLENEIQDIFDSCKESL